MVAAKIQQPEVKAASDLLSDAETGNFLRPKTATQSDDKRHAQHPIAGMLAYESEDERHEVTSRTTIKAAPHNIFRKAFILKDKSIKVRPKMKQVKCVQDGFQRRQSGSNLLN